MFSIIIGWHRRLPCNSLTFDWSSLPSRSNSSIPVTKLGCRSPIRTVKHSISPGLLWSLTSPLWAYEVILSSAMTSRANLGNCGASARQRPPARRASAADCCRISGKGTSVLCVVRDGWYHCASGVRCILLRSGERSACGLNTMIQSARSGAVLWTSSLTSTINKASGMSRNSTNSENGQKSSSVRCS